VRVREVREEPKMSLEEVHPESYDYEQTLMYGKFTSELRDFARRESFKIRREQVERRLEEQESKKASGGQTSGVTSTIVT
jgi:hypothetical protein